MQKPHPIIDLLQKKNIQRLHMLLCLEQLQRVLLGMNNPIKFKEKFSKFADHLYPKVIAEMNDYQFKLVKVKGEFVWHNHSDTDEVFIVIEGCLKIEFAEETVELNAGEMYVVPKGVQHKPYSDEECKILLVEPKGVVNTGEAEGELTASNDVWI